MSAELDVTAYLTTKGYTGKQASGPEVVYPCFFDCGESPDSTKRKLYVNTDTGMYDCKVCGASGGTYLLQQHFGDDPKDGSDLAPEANVTRREILNWATQIGQKFLDANEEVLLYLMNERGLEPETIYERRLGFIQQGWSLTQSLPERFKRDDLLETGLVVKDGPRKGRDFFFRHILIPFVHRGNVQQVRGRIWGEAKGGKYFTGPGEHVYLYNADDLNGATEAIVVEGEFDAMVLKQHLSKSTVARIRNIAVVGLAGTGAFPDNFESYFRDISRIFVGFDSDEAGKKAVEKVKEKLGQNVRVLQLPTGEDGRGCDWSDYLLPIPEDADSLWKAEHPFAGHTWQDVTSLLGNASGRRVFSISEAGAAYRASREINKGFKTGYKRIDGILHPGLLPGQVWIVLAKTGAGKTVFLVNLAYNMLAYRQLFISLEMTREEVYMRLRRVYLFHHPLASDAELEYALSNVWITDENRVTEQGLDSLLEEFTAEVGQPPEIVHVDYLQYFARGAKGNGQYEKATNAVMGLKAVAKRHRAVIVSPSQVNRGAKDGKPIELDGARDSGAVEETADFLFAYWRPDDALDTDATGDNKPKQTGVIRVAVLKSRHGGKGEEFNLQMDLLSLAVVDAFTPAARKAQEHNRLAARGMSWDDLRAQELAPRQLQLVKR